MMRNSSLFLSVSTSMPIRLACAAAAVVLAAGCGGDGNSNNGNGTPPGVDGGNTPAGVANPEPVTPREDPTAAVSPAVPCESFTGQAVGDVQVTAAVRIPATGSLPAYCKVNGTQIGTQHDIEVRLPDVWQRRFVQQGGGGYDGVIPAVGSTNVALSQNAVLTANNGGHRDSTGAVLLNNPAVIQLYAHTAINVATKFGKATAEKYYAKKANYSYYQGCSNGGRGALNAAAKYGSDFDAVIAGAPTRNLPGQIGQWTRAATLAIPEPAKLTAINAAVVAKCDALDGVSDGIVSNWSACKFDPTKDVSTEVGLTTAEASSINSLLTDLKLADGRTIYSAFGWGNMASSAPFYGFLGVGHMKNIVLNDANWSPVGFAVDTYYPKIADVVDGYYGFSASTGDLSNFLKAGRKIVVWQGSDDSLLSHKDTIRTWEPVLTSAGASGSENSRLYIAAGVAHCSGGPGADSIDLLTPTMAWVERGVDPGTPVAKKLNASGTTLFSRPLCQHPSYPKYRGTGDINDSINYQCTPA